MSLPRPLARFLITLAIFRESWRRRNEPVDDIDCALHVGAPMESDYERLRKQYGAPRPWPAPPQRSA